MIQRIQSIFLLVAFIAGILTFLFPLAQISGELNLLEIYIYGIVDLTKMGGIEVNSGIIAGLIAIGGIIPLISIIAIFLYKNRLRQANLARIGFFINIVLVIFLFLFIDFIKKQTGSTVTYQLGIGFPLISVIMLIMSRRAILNDERKVRAADRLR